MFEVNQLAVGGFDQNCSYVAHGTVSGECLMIDPSGDTEMIRASLEKYPDRVPKYILLTHGHNDHVSGVKQVRCFFPVPADTLGHQKQVNPYLRIDGLAEFRKAVKEL